MTSSILHVASPLVRAVTSSSCSYVTPAISVPVATTRRTVQLLVSLLHHGEATITRDEKTNLGAVLESIEDLGNCLEIKVGEGGYDVDEIASSSTTRISHEEYTKRSKYLADLNFDNLMAELDATLSEMGVHPIVPHTHVDDVDREFGGNNSNSNVPTDLNNEEESFHDHNDHVDADTNAFMEEVDADFDLSTQDSNNNHSDRDEGNDNVHQNNVSDEESSIGKRLRKRRTRMAYPHGEEGPGHVGKLPQDVGSTRLVPSSTSRKGKKSDQVADKVDAMKEKKKIQRKDEYQRNKEKYKEYYQKNKGKCKEKYKEYYQKIKDEEKYKERKKTYYEINKEEILKKKKKYLSKMKEKRKEVSCDVTFDLILLTICFVFVLTYLNFELQDANLDAKWKEMRRNQAKRAALRKKMKEALSCGDGPADADGLEEEEINIVEELSENLEEEEEDDIQSPHGNEKAGADVNEDEGEESSNDEEYSHSRFLLETRDRVLGRGRLED